MLKSTIIVTAICFCTTLFGQNLVPNPSFEKYNHKAHKGRMGNTNIFDLCVSKAVNDWYSATSGTPDLRILDDNNHVKCQHKEETSDLPRTGKNVAGIITHMENQRTGGAREYIQVRLKAPLQPGKIATFELWTKNESYSEHLANNIGFYFSTNRIYIDFPGPIKLKPQYNHNQLITREDGWVQIKGSFVPDKAYNYLTIGNFFGMQDTKLENPTRINESIILSHPKAYYLIDDVAVYQDKTPPPTPVTKPIAPTKPVNTFKETPIIVGTTIELKNVEFDTNSDILKPSSYPELSELIAWLQSSPSVKIGIHGHTDNVGSNADNLQLSINRAKRIFDYLINKGIQPNRLNSKGFGESNPIADNTSDEGRKRNRRVEFIVVSK